MGIIQSLDARKFSTFGDLAEYYMKSKMEFFSTTRVVVDIFDRYDNPNSIKSAERDRRTPSGSNQTFHVSEGRNIPDWKKFLSNSRNKQALISYLGEQLVKLYTRDNPLKDYLTIYLAGTFHNHEVVKKIEGNVATECKSPLVPTKKLIHVLSSTLCLLINSSALTVLRVG